MALGSLLSGLALISRLFDRHRFRHVARLVDVAALLHADVIGEQLQRDVEQKRVELGLGGRHVERGVDRDRFTVI